MGRARRKASDLGSADAIKDDLRCIRSAGGFAGAGPADVQGTMTKCPSKTFEDSLDLLRSATSAELVSIEKTPDPHNTARTVGAVSLLRMLFQDPPIPREITDVRSGVARDFNQSIDYVRAAEDKTLRAIAPVIWSAMVDKPVERSIDLDLLVKLIRELKAEVGHGEPMWKTPKPVDAPIEDFNFDEVKRSVESWHHELRAWIRLFQFSISVLDDYRPDAVDRVAETKIQSRSNAIVAELERLVRMYPQSYRSDGLIDFARAIDASGSMDAFRSTLHKTSDGVAALLDWRSFTAEHHDVCPWPATGDGWDNPTCPFHEFVDKRPVQAVSASAAAL